MMGRTRRQLNPYADGLNQFMNELNQFYACYDVTEFRRERDRVCECLASSPVKLSEHEVTKCLLRVNPRQTPGPGGLGGTVLKFCAGQLGPVLAQLSQQLNFEFACDTPVVKNFYDQPTSEKSWS